MQDKYKSNKEVFDWEKNQINLYKNYNRESKNNKPNYKKNVSILFKNNSTHEKSVNNEFNTIQKRHISISRDNLK